MPKPTPSFELETREGKDRVEVFDEGANIGIQIWDEYSNCVGTSLSPLEAKRLSNVLNHLSETAQLKHV
jgi:hypothetical protein